MPKFYFDYTNYRGEASVDRAAEPVAIRYGTSKYHSEEQWLFLMHDLAKGEGREFTMQDMKRCRPHFSMLVFTKDTVHQIVVRLEEISRHSGAPQHVKNLAREALKEFSRNKSEDDVEQTNPDGTPKT